MQDQKDLLVAGNLNLKIMPGKEIKGRSKIASYKKGGRVKANQGGYIGKYIEGDLGGVKVSNPSYKKYYKGLV